MPSGRIQRRIDALLDEVESAAQVLDWVRVRDLADGVLRLDPENEDARAFVEASNRDTGLGAPAAAPEAPPPPRTPAVEHPFSFVAGRYAVRRFLGEGGKKRVYLAHDERLDRDVAFALIKTDGLDEVGRERIVREAQAMGRMGAHPHIVGIYEIGEEAGAPYVVTELLAGGDVEGLLADQDGALPLARTLEIAKGVARGLAFAHQQGVVHRDLKPGNTWLTSDGVAKIGDFGLAVALDRSRLTTHGLMVGTVAYMPPEQALGGEVTPQADLYSLGAMLYELVTGKPPFAGDSPTAIISQHINTPPVAPSWHSEHCPPDLEALILKLLAKVPADRPASALEVLEALERVDPEAPSVRHSDSSANPLDRLARGVFVGRERELERLRAAFDEAFAGRGSVVMLVGEPGIGKTRTSLELETYARMRGAKVLWGRANESSGAPPYFPWTQLGRAYAAATDDATLTNQLRDYAVELQRLFPGVRNRFPGLPEPPPVEDESAQFRLFDAMSGFYRDVAVPTPLVLVLDDLHWADRPTLALLTHLARELTRARILVVGTYRDTDLDRQHPLSRTLAELNREQLFTRINLRGLTRDEVGEYIRATAQVEPSARLVERMHEETEGNAFFLAEVVNLMAQEGSFEKTSVSDVAIPEGVKEALGRRLDRLSPAANELLSLAAVVGREFDHAQLVAVSARADDEALRLTEEALAARVLEETSAVGGYRFTHALMQETLLGELSAARRVRLHGQIAEALDALYGESADAHAPELARHYLESSALNRGHARAAARYSRIAAEQAAAALAYDEAAAHYERCIELLQMTPDGLALGEDEAALHHGRGVALRNGGDWTGGYAELDRAMGLHRQRGDSEGFVCSALEALVDYLARPRAEREPIVMEALALAPTRELWAALAVSYVQSYFDSTADELAEEARAIAETRGLTDLVAQLEYREGERALLEGRYQEAAVSLLRAPEMGAITTGQRQTVHNLIGSAELARGLVDAALATYRGAEAFGAASRLPFTRAVASSLSGRIHLLRGDLATADADLDAAEAVGTFAMVAFSRARLSALRGDLDEAVATLRAHQDFTGAAAASIRGLLTRYLLLGHAPDDVLQKAYAGFLATFKERDAVTGIPNVASRAAGIEAIAAIGEESDVRDAYELLLKLTAAVGFAGITGESYDHLRGLLALRLGLVDEAEGYFDRGIAMCERERCPIEAGRCHQGLVEVAERRGDLEAAREHLDAAAALFAKHGAKLYLDQVLAKKEILKA